MQWRRRWRRERTGGNAFSLALIWIALFRDVMYDAIKDGEIRQEGGAYPFGVRRHTMDILRFPDFRGRSARCCSVSVPTLAGLDRTGGKHTLSIADRVVMDGADHERRARGGKAALEYSCRDLDWARRQGRITHRVRGRQGTGGRWQSARWRGNGRRPAEATGDSPLADLTQPRTQTRRLAQDQPPAFV